MVLRREDFSTEVSLVGHAAHPVCTRFCGSLIQPEDPGKHGEQGKPQCLVALADAGGTISGTRMALIARCSGADTGSTLTHMTCVSRDRSDLTPLFYCMLTPPSRSVE